MAFSILCVIIVNRKFKQMTKIFFIRHAQPNYDNHNDLLRELSAKGMSDRKLVTAFLEDKKIDAVLSSPYKRAVDTVGDFADKYGFKIETEEDFRERKIDSDWIENFTAFTKKQWEDFEYKLSDGECLKEVQERNISALKRALERYQGKTLAVGSHGTALSTIINFYNKAFGYEDFERIKNIMPWIVEMDFDEKGNCSSIREHLLEN